MSLENASQYQRLTAYNRLEMGGGSLDWSNKPNLYKTYPQAGQTPLPRELTLPKAPAWAALKRVLNPSPRPVTLDALSNLLFMAYGFTHKVDYGTETFLYRSAPSAGALYPVDVYLAARDIQGLDDGLYHYSVMDFSLQHIRRGLPKGIDAPALILTGLFFRSAWKYKDRAFRYCLLDVGHTAENFMITGYTLGLDPVFCAEFDDKAINEALGLDSDKEAALAVVRLGRGGVSTGEEADDGASTVDLPEAEPVAPKEIVFDLVSEAARLTAVPLKKEPAAFDARPEGVVMTMPEADWTDFEGPTLVGAMQNRRSRRNFKPDAVSKENLVRFLDLLQLQEHDRTPNLGFIPSHVPDVPDGFYGCRNHSTNIISRRPGFLGPALSSAALGQEWLGRAMINLAFTADLGALEEKLGPRALRLAYLESGRIGQRAYLAAEVFGWGCCGIGAFFDADVSRILNLPPGEDPLYIVPVGPIKKRTHGGRPKNAGK